MAKESAARSEDQANGAALRRLVESGHEISIAIGDNLCISNEPNGKWTVGGMRRYVIATNSTLPEAVEAALNSSESAKVHTP